jgi:hypothetical protein
VGLSFVPFVNWFDQGEFGKLLRWSQLVIDLADGDPVKGAGFGMGSPLAAALSMRGVCAWWLGHPGWRQDLDAGLTMARDSDPATLVLLLAWTNGLEVAYGVLRSDDTVVREMEEARQLAEATSDDTALGMAEYALGVVLLNRDADADRHRGMELAVSAIDMWRARGPHLVAVTESALARERARRGAADAAIPVLRNSVQELRQANRLGFGVWAVGLLIETLLERGRDGDLAEARVEIEWLANLSADQRSAVCDVTLLQLRALLARARGDDAAHRDLAIRYRAMAESLGFEGHLDWAEAMLEGID